MTDVINVFMLFIPATVIYVFNVLYLVKFLNTLIENSIKNFKKYFWKHINELIGLDFIMKHIAYRAYYIMQWLLNWNWIKKRSHV